MAIFTQITAKSLAQGFKENSYFKSLLNPFDKEKITLKNHDHNL